MSTQLEAQGIALMQGYEPAHLEPVPDLVVIGNALSRGNAAVEHVLNRGIPYTSGPGFLADYVLKDRWVLAVAGTHGKTTTSSMLAWILEYAGLRPGFLIGGVPNNFGLSARLGDVPFFVVEADEYDTAFFDKRSKFVHYRPRTTVLNNLEFDHADIFPDLAAIQRQFHHLVRTVPGNGLLIAPQHDHNIDTVLAHGCWTPVERLALGTGQDWSAEDIAADGSRIAVLEPRSNTMRLGVHREELAPSLAAADAVLLYQPADLRWDVSAVVAAVGPHAQAQNDIAGLVRAICDVARPGDHVLIMSNGGFGGLHEKLAKALKTA